MAIEQARAGDLTGAVATTSEIAQKNSRSRAAKAIGDAYLSRGALDEALGLARAVDAGWDRDDLFLAIATWQLESGDPNGAVVTWRSAVSGNPGDDIDFHNTAATLAQRLTRAGELEAAIAVARLGGSCGSSPCDSSTWVQAYVLSRIVVSLVDLGRPERAVEVARTIRTDGVAWNLHPLDPIVQHYIRAGEPTRARELVPEILSESARRVYLDQVGRLEAGEPAAQVAGSVTDHAQTVPETLRRTDTEIRQAIQESVRIDDDENRLTSAKWFLLRLVEDINAFQESD